MPARAHAHPWHWPWHWVHLIAWGDFPTWLAVIGAIIGALAALRQLRSQQKDIARQTQLLERQQANAIDLLPDKATGAGSGVLPPGSEELVHAARVTNGSSRPIRNVASRIEPGPGESPQLATRIGEWVPTGPLDRTFLSWRDGSHVAVIRADAREFLFPFPFIAKDYPAARIAIRFTDDAGLHWQIDHDLHLEKLDTRDW